MKKIIYSGICICGHTWEKHHLCCVVRLEAYNWCVANNHPPYIPCECEYYGCNEMGGRDKNGEPHCFGYVDVDDPERKKCVDIYYSQETTIIHEVDGEIL